MKKNLIVFLFLIPQVSMAQNVNISYLYSPGNMGLGLLELAGRWGRIGADLQVSVKSAHGMGFFAQGTIMNYFPIKDDFYTKYWGERAFQHTYPGLFLGIEGYPFGPWGDGFFWAIGPGLKYEINQSMDGTRENSYGPIAAASAQLGYTWNLGGFTWGLIADVFPEYNIHFSSFNVNYDLYVKLGWTF